MESDLLHSDLTRRIIGAAMEVHRSLGPGLLESCYERCLKFELESRRMLCRSQVELPVSYKGVPIDCSYRIDLVVSELVV